MASRLSKLYPRILVPSIAVFIFLSGSTVSEEATRCYWCGPLAEQVHRSQRSPACDRFDQHQIVCDKGYTHCAIVATSPPYAESRLCVKFYQDECYSLYCNSTKTWRMVCACRGDLCNGPRSDRENKAFAIIARTALKTNAKIKRALISGFNSVKTKGPSDNSTIIIIQNETANSDLVNSVQGDQPPAEIDPAGHKTPAIDAPKHSMDENIIIEHGYAKKNDGFAHTTHSKSNYENNMNNAPPTMAAIESKHTDNAKIYEPSTLVANTAADIEKATNDVVSVPTKIKPTSIEVEVSVPHRATTDKLPPAEALQQNVTPTKAMETTTIATKATNTEINSMTQTTTQANEIKKNIGTQNLYHTIIFVTTFILHICL